MGMIRVDVAGSFGWHEPKTFSAMKTGHADAVAQAIEYLAKEVLPEAIRTDHACHEDKAFPSDGFAKRQP